MKALKELVAVAAVGIVLGLGQPASAALSNFTTTDSGVTYTGGGSSLSQVIPDNNYAGVGYTINFTDGSVNISALTFTLNTIGGYNGDIYAYISHGGILVQLLNPDGAVCGSGMDITLGTTGSVLPTSGVLSSGNYISYEDLSAFNNMSASGNWTVFFADLGAGDTSSLNEFTIGITAVPERTTWGLIGFGMIFGGVTGARVIRARRRACPH